MSETFAERVQVPELINATALDTADRTRIGQRAASLVEALRRDNEPAFLDAFLAEYGLSNEEGVALLSMAEAFLRVPDADTLDVLVKEKLTGSDWQSHSGHASSFLVNASTWALMITGRLLSSGQAGRLVDSMRGLLQRLGEPVVRSAMSEAMERMGNHFVLGESIEQACKRAGEPRYSDSYFSYDMLGEAARTETDAEAYLNAYQDAITAIGKQGGENLAENPGISVKLSALHPRFDWLQREHSFTPLLDRLLVLAEQAEEYNIGLSIDAEEISRRDYTLELFEETARAMQRRNWPGLGVVVQAYAADTPALINRLTELARATGSRFMVRLVKGAYWDTEIKRAQIFGLADYPVYTRKCDTDVSYLAAARQLLRAGEFLYPQFATHNAHTMAAVLHMAEQEGRQDWEFQRLYGMGATLHNLVQKQAATRHRIYAPVGEHEDLLAYLVRRLLENGANSSFVHQITDESIPVSQVVADPIASAMSGEQKTLPLPGELYLPRRNSRGWDLGSELQVEALLELREPWAERRWHTKPMLVEVPRRTKRFPVMDPAQPEEQVGTVRPVSFEDIDEAVAAAADFAHKWATTPIKQRSELLLETARLLENTAGEILALLSREAGKTLADAISEWREAIDFLRYYAVQAEELGGRARGPMACISPWNFPLAIFTGQIAAALVTGNPVLAKPAEQTPLIAGRMTSLFHEAGVPAAALQLLPGDGEVGAALCRNRRLQGVCFTGSLDTARRINRSIADHLPEDACLIAETGGINAMIVDSTALPEQAVEDIITSAFASAGQRCSALRVLYIQEEVYDRILTMLKGAMDALSIGDPWRLCTDIGPVIDAGAKNAIYNAITDREILHQLPTDSEGHYVPPTLIPVSGIGAVRQEVFGPVLFVASYAANELSDVIDAINRAGYGLTFAMHSRLVERTERCVARLRIGNIYINRNQVGAVVESQPFGGEGLSGTGPKAGGPAYLSAFRRYPRSTRAVFALADGYEYLTEEALRTAWRELDNSGWREQRNRIALVSEVVPDTERLQELPEAGQHIMPGPTGERNRYRLVPLDRVLCLGPMPHEALDQAVTAVAAGCAALVLCAANAELRRGIKALQAAGAPVTLLTAIAQPEMLTDLKNLEAVCWWQTARLTRDIRQALAAREGPIVRFISSDSPCSMYYHERHVCNDTTRAGGNIELMARHSG